MKGDFWIFLQRLVDTSEIKIDRPKGTLHPRYIQQPYPVNYGYLEGTSAIDAGGVDIWVGSLGKKKVCGALCTVDLRKKDTELKILLDCTDEEIIVIMEFVNSGDMRAYYIKREN